MTIRPVLIAAIGLALGTPLISCGEEVRDEPTGVPKSDVRETGGLDPEPEKLGGSESHEFEEEDIEAAGDASRLIEFYCEARVVRGAVRGLPEPCS
jgi:hypothetical protein